MGASLRQRQKRDRPTGETQQPDLHHHWRHPAVVYGYQLVFPPDIYVPAMMAQGLSSDGNDMLSHRGYRGFDMIGRLQPGVTVAQAQAEINGIMRDLERTYPDT